MAEIYQEENDISPPTSTLPQKRGANDIEATKKKRRKEDREEKKGKKRAEIEAAKAAGKIWLQKYTENTCTKCIEQAREMERLTSELEDTKSALRVKNSQIEELQNNLAEKEATAHQLEVRLQKSEAMDPQTSPTSLPGKLIYKYSLLS